MRTYKLTLAEFQRELELAKDNPSKHAMLVCSAKIVDDQKVIIEVIKLNEGSESPWRN